MAALGMDAFNMSEKYRKHCMILENCCYDWFEMNTLNMAQQGVFGEVIRAQGAYIHNLSPFWNHYWKNGENDKLGWRLDYNMRHRGDVYATHGLGPVAQALDIHRGDRMKTLVAMDTKSAIGKALVEERADSICNNFRNGDHTTTLIRTENGKVIEIQHNVMTPRNLTIACINLRVLKALPINIRSAVMLLMLNGGTVVIHRECSEFGKTTPLC